MAEEMRCDQCGVEIPAGRKPVEKEGRHFCSQACAQKMQR